MVGGLIEAMAPSETKCFAMVLDTTFVHIDMGSLVFILLCTTVSALSHFPPHVSLVLADGFP